jgi:hypothetical protein
MKEEINMRFKNARDAAIIDGLIEMGRRRINTAQSGSDTTEYVAVPLARVSPTKSDTPRLSTETYLHLLPLGLALALQSQPTNGRSTPGEGPTMDKNVTEPSIAQRCVFVNNFPLETEATQLVKFFETTNDCQVERIELEQGNWNRSMCISAHIQFTTSHQASAFLQQCKTSGLIYRGRRLFVVVDRTTPESVALKNATRPSEMSYTIVKPDATLESNTAQQSPSTNLVTAQDQGLFGNMSFDATWNENRPDPVTNNPVQHVSPHKDSLATTQPILTPRKDPFEDLLW